MVATVFGQDTIWGLISGVYTFWAVGKSLEDMGTPQMLLLFMVGCSQPMLGRGSLWAPSSRVLPSVWPGCWDHLSPLSPLCFRKRILVPFHFTNQTQAFSPQPTETSFHNLWEKVSSAASGMIRQVINYLISLEHGLYGHTTTGATFMVQLQVLQAHL